MQPNIKKLELTNPKQTVYYYVNDNNQTIIHRDNLPAVIDGDGTQKYYHHGVLHRENGHAIIYPENIDSINEYWLNGKFYQEEEWKNINMSSKQISSLSKDDKGQYWKLPDGTLHREDGPAYIGENGDEVWWLNGKIHREEGAALSWADGTLKWYRQGILHNQDGPAIIWGRDIKANPEYYLTGYRYHFKDWARTLNKTQLYQCELCEEFLQNI